MPILLQNKNISLEMQSTILVLETLKIFFLLTPDTKLIKWIRLFRAQSKTYSSFQVKQKEIIEFASLGIVRLIGDQSDNLQRIILRLPKQRREKLQIAVQSLDVPLIHKYLSLQLQIIIIPILKEGEDINVKINQETKDKSSIKLTNQLPCQFLNKRDLLTRQVVEVDFSRQNSLDKIKALGRYQDIIERLSSCDRRIVLIQLQSGGRILI
ncbi:hypothetical protein pb186bvf_017750 [Paramecium bursaria]